LLGLLVLEGTLRAVPTADAIQKAFVALDATKNEAISLAEWEQDSFALFKAADTNRDNHLGRDEISPGSVAVETFLTADTDQNGKLSIGEYMNLRRAIFRAADINRDDYLVLYEYEIFHLLAEFGWHDRNKNGRIDPTELRAALTHAFDQLDTDHDRFLNPAESAFLAPGHRTNMEKSTGKISAEAFVAGYLQLLTG
jgi:Ca2+-binding EF-hand superfamily protein